MHRFTLPTLAALALAGCASTSELPEYRTDRSTVSVQTNTGSSDMQLTHEAAVSSEVIAASADQLWRALPGIYQSLGIPINGADSNARLLATRERVRRIDGKSMSTYFNCPGPYGNLAGSGDVYLSLRTQILPSSDTQATVRHEIEAVARASSGTNQVRCNSRGALERLLNEALAAATEGE